MKIQSTVCLISALSLLALGAGCSSLGGNQTSSKELSANGPTILNARTEPSTVELNPNLQPKEAPQVLADVKDFNSNVNNVKLRFVHVPLEIPMHNIGGTTWEGRITQKQLSMLAVAGKTMNYEANIIAKNEAGQTAVTESPITVSVKAPDVTPSFG